MIHLYKFELYDEINTYLTNLKKINIQYDLYVNISIDSTHEGFRKNYIIDVSKIVRIKR